jgi:hypothetical protein
MTITAAGVRASARRLLGRTGPKPADQWSVVIYTIDGNAQTCKVVDDFSAALAVVRAQGDTPGQILYLRVPVHATSRQRDELWESGATLLI